MQRGRRCGAMGEERHEAQACAAQCASGCGGRSIEAREERIDGEWRGLDHGRLTENEVRALLARLEGTRWLIVSVLYGTGMRLLECLRLRVKDVDFEMRQITIREGKGNRDRVTMLPATLIEPLRNHLSSRCATTYHA